MPDTSPLSTRARLELVAPGLALCLIVAAAARFLSEHYGAPQMLFALMLGMALHFLMEEGRSAAGVDFAARHILRIGVALLGVRITFDEVGDLGAPAVLWMAGGIVLTIGFGVLAVRLTGQNRRFGLLSGGAVAICGASAAMAIAAVLPRDARSERDTILVVVTVTALSTLAMIIYPTVTAALGLDDRAAGIFLGGTIHDVAQVVGAGYSVSPETGDTATIAKLFRVAMLMPVVLIIGLGTRAGGGPKAPLPMFVLGFAALVVANSLGAVPPVAAEWLSTVSGWCLVTAIAALGIKTSLKALFEVGSAPLLLLLGETLVLALWVGLGLGLGV
ncbi:putative sulfate exporter family transporter [Pseudooceanicola sp. 216_PA32_1]|uniref:Putative sulfate exporter family transporter n=1 Tax=Pseudooceanicola pacificus TaxID=2676438 RepID=A0A844WDC9_9RHOB|nr:putative sulfate exporter family transporter [Pseudooceanicola pacificus]MWB78392.1 putative sulfate exporter family transporter [Pseudooceanicola pacificus]